MSFDLNTDQTAGFKPEKGVVFTVNEVRGFPPYDKLSEEALNMLRVYVDLGLAVLCYQLHSLG